MGLNARGTNRWNGTAAMALTALFLTLLASRALPAAEAPGPPPQVKVVTDVSVVDVERGTVVPGCGVLVDGDKIVKVAPQAELTVPEGAQIIVGKGLYLIPGLVDAHVHYVDPATYGPLMIAHGVTLVRDMGSANGVILTLRDQLNRGETLGPEMVATGAILDGDPPVWPFSIVCRTPEEARQAVRAQVAAGADQIKVYSRLKKDVYLAAVDEAHKNGKKAVGHVPIEVTLQEAMQAGQDSDEHLLGFGLAIAELAGKPAAEAPGAMERSPSGWMYCPGLDKAKLAAFLRDLRANGMVQCPTLVVIRGIGRQADPKAAEDPMLQYVPVQLRELWETETFQGAREGARMVQPHMQAFVGEMHRAGVPIMCGTDLANPNVIAGHSLHEEMEMFQDAGIAPADVLRCAISVPVRFMGLEGRLGSVSEGRTASLVLLRANPLEDVRNTRDIEGVFLRGRYFSRADLDGLLAGVRDSVKGSMPVEGKVALSLPGEVIARGRYMAKFQTYDAGSEEFLITKTDDGYRLMAHNEPKGGFQVPFVLTMHVGPDFRFRAAEWRQLSAAQLMATYTAEDGRIRTEAAQAGQALAPQEMAMPENAAVSGMAYADDFLLVGLAGLEVGQTKELQSVSFGYPSWQLSVAPLTVTREPDAQLTRPEGEVAARVYAKRLQTPIGEFNTRLWTDPAGVVLRSVLTMPFGTVEAARE